MNKEILRLAVPNILSNISVPLMSSVDTYLMGQLSPAHLGAIGLGSMIFNFMYWNFGFLRMGTTGLVAQAFGQNNPTGWTTQLSKGVFLAICLGSLLVLLQGPLAKLGIIAFQVLPDQVDMVFTYFGFRIWAAPAALLIMVLMGWSFGMQNAWIPLVTTIAINILNIGVSYYLVHHMNYGIAGVALGTIISQYAGLLLLILLIRKVFAQEILRLREHLTFKWSAWWSYLIMNRDIFIRTIFLTTVFAFFYRQSSAADTILLAVNIILLQMLNWMSYGIDGFAYAAESLAGKYYGQKDQKMFEKCLRLLFMWSFGLAFLYAAVYGATGRHILHFFADGNEDILSQGRAFVLWMVAIPFIAVASYLWDGIFIGLTASKAMRDSMILSVLLFVLAYYCATPWGNHGLWFALTVFLLTRGIIQSWMYYKKGWELK